MRVTFLLPSYATRPIGGYRVVYELANGLAARGAEVSVVLPRTLAPPAGAVDAAKSFAWPVKRGLARRLGADWFSFHETVTVRAVRRFSKRAVPRGDVICTTGWEAGEAALRLGGQWGRKVHVAQDYEFWRLADPPQRARIEASFRGHDLLVSTSLAVERMLAEVGLSPGVRIRPGVDHSIFKPLGLPPAPLSAVFPARPETTKGTVDAILACERLRAHFGEGFAAHAFGAVDGLDTPPFIRVHKGLNDGELAALLNRSRVFMLPSRLEGFGMTGLEAMACGVPVVAADCVGVRDYLEPDINGLLAAPEAPNELAAQAAKLIETPELSSTLAAAGIRTAARYRWEDAVSAFARGIASPDDA